MYQIRLPVKQVSITLILVLFIILGAAAQEGGKYIQFSGIVLTHDSLRAVSYSSIRIVGTNKGSVADGEGFFNFVAREGDSIQFSALGYKTVYTVIPRNLDDNKYSWIQLMREDTFYLAETMIRPWPSKEEIDRFLATGDAGDSYALARSNLERQKLARIEQTMPADGPENQRLMANYQAARYYYTGQAPPVRVLDPIAWASFFKAWRSGQFKKGR